MTRPAERIKETDPVSAHLLAVARGDEPADLALVNARIVNVFTGTIEPGCVAVAGARIASVGPARGAHRTIDLRGSFIGPGYLDAHMHVESTMLTPARFAQLAAAHGTTGAVFDPHEIANVLGMPGIRMLMRDACPPTSGALPGAGAPMRAMFAASSCVPSSPLETAGATLSAADLAPLFDDDRVVALAEVMNYPGVVNADPGVLAKVNLGLRRRIVDGHAPRLTGDALQAYAAAGISSDHECTTADEAREKLALGMHIHIREGSAARNLRALLPLVNADNWRQFSFCTDDRHPADLVNQGHIDHVVRTAIELGLDPVLAIRIATISTAMHYNQRDRGAIAPGRFADMQVFDDLRSPRARLVLFEGRVVFDAQSPEPDDAPCAHSAALNFAGARGTVRLHSGFGAHALRVPGRAGVRIRVIRLVPGQIVTDAEVLEARTEGGECISDPARDLLKMAVIERHRATGNIGLGFVRGFGLKRGAIASTVGHDAHNLAVVGVNDADMAAAARALEAAGGGQCAVENGVVRALLALPIAGLISDQPVRTVIEQQHALHRACREMGCVMDDPFMPLSFLPLPVIPRLKLTDLGLVDVEKFRVVPLEA